MAVTVVTKSTCDRCGHTGETAAPPETRAIQQLPLPSNWAREVWRSKEYVLCPDCVAKINPLFSVDNLTLDPTPAPLNHLSSADYASTRTA